MKDPAHCKVKYDYGDFPTEEQYLAGKHAQGYAFVAWNSGNVLQFEPAPAETYTYRLDYCPEKGGEEHWLQQAKSSGWEYVGKLHTWMCLRKPGRQDGKEEEAQGLFHNLLERGTRGRHRAEKEMLVGVLPMAFFYVLGILFKNADFAGTLWTLATLFLIVAIVIVFPAFKVRSKCGVLMDQWYKDQKALEESTPEIADPENSVTEIRP